MTRQLWPVVSLAVAGALIATGAPAAQVPAAPAAPTQAGPPAPNAPPITPMDETRRVQADDIDKLLADGKTVLLDVREPKEIEELGTIEGSINIPLGQLEARMGELPKDKLILTA